MRIDYVIRASLLALRQPQDQISRFRGSLDRRRDRRDWETIGRTPAEVYQRTTDWQSQLNSMLGSTGACDADPGFEQVWLDIGRSIGLRGVSEPLSSDVRRPFDVNRSLGEAAWCAIRHLRPEVIVETGVARGITSRVLLEAMEANGRGHLWSIDLPHPALGEPGVAVTDTLKSRWDLLLGTSRELLPKLLEQLGPIDMFVHDSLHTGRNVEFELELAWPHLRPGGLLFADDLHTNLGFHRFVERHRIRSWFGASGFRRGIWGVALKE